MTDGETRKKMDRKELKMLHALLNVQLKQEDLLDYIDYKGEDSLVLLKLPGGTKEILDTFPEICGGCSKKKSGTCVKVDTIVNDFLTGVFMEGFVHLAREGLRDVMKGELHVDAIKGLLGGSKS